MNLLGAPLFHLTWFAWLRSWLPAQIRCGRCRCRTYRCRRRASCTYAGCVQELVSCFDSCNTIPLGKSCEYDIWCTSSLLRKNWICARCPYWFWWQSIQVWYAGWNLRCWWCLANRWSRGRMQGQTCFARALSHTFMSRKRRLVPLVRLALYVRARHFCTTQEACRNSRRIAGAYICRCGAVRLQVARFIWHLW